MTRARLLAAALVLGALAWAAPQALDAVRTWRWAQGLLDSVAPPKPGDAGPVACAGPGERPVVVLALGQSNAGNHGGLDERPARVRLFHDGHCLDATDPLPGSTGRGGSVWSLLPAALRDAGVARPVVVSAVGLDGTPIVAWTDRRSPLRWHLRAHLAAMRRAGVVPDAVLWQQGEGDAQRNTDPAAYRERLLALSTLLRDGGYHGPLLLARSTRCRSQPHAALRQAVDDAAAQQPDRFAIGPDTDRLEGPARLPDDCHLSAAGRAAAAQAWAQALAPRFGR